MKKIVKEKTFVSAIKSLCVITLLLLFILILFKFFNKTNVTKIENDWSYSFVNNVTYEGLSFEKISKIKNWIPVSVKKLSDLKESANSDLLVLKVKLPKNIAQNTYLLIPEIQHCYAVYLKEEQIFSFGEKDNWLSACCFNIIKLPTYSKDTYIYFKIYSEMRNIGALRNDFVIGSEIELIKYIFAKDLPLGFISAVCFFLSFLFLAIFIFSFRRKVVLNFSAFTFFSAVHLFSCIGITQLLFFSDYNFLGLLELFSFYSLIIAGNFFFKDLLEFNNNHLFSIFSCFFLFFVFLIYLSPFISIDLPARFLFISECLLMIDLVLVFVFSLKYLIEKKIPLGMFFVILFALIAFVFELLQKLSIIPFYFPVYHFGILFAGSLMIYDVHSDYLEMFYESKDKSKELKIKNIALEKSKKELESLNDEIDLTQQEIVYHLSEIAEARSKETGNHVRRVAGYCKVLAEGLGLSADQVHLIELASSMHDIGKLGVPDAILNKPGKLTIAEYEDIKKHTVIGYEMLNHSNRELFTTAALIAYQHHEYYNGGGYPLGLKGEEIHIYGRITAVADVFDSLASERVYKTAWPLESVLTYLQNGRGQLFDPQIIDLFFEKLDDILAIQRTWEDF